jgi:hypothetical protein
MPRQEDLCLSKCWLYLLGKKDVQELSVQKRLVPSKNLAHVDFVVLTNVLDRVLLQDSHKARYEAWDLTFICAEGAQKLPNS